MYSTSGFVFPSLPTVQVDFNLPQRFDLFYIDSNSDKKRPIIIHRAILGSLERFFGILIERYAGDVSLWLSPVQACIVTCNRHSGSISSKGSGKDERELGTMTINEVIEKIQHAAANRSFIA